MRALQFTLSSTSGLTAGGAATVQQSSDPNVAFYLPFPDGSGGSVFRALFLLFKV